MSSILTPMQRLAVAVGFRFDDGAHLWPNHTVAGLVFDTLTIRSAIRKLRATVPRPAEYDPGADDSDANDNVAAEAILANITLTPEQHARIARAEEAATLTARAEALREEADRLIERAEALERQ